MLDIELPRYSCKICNTFPGQSAGGTIFRKATTELFPALRNWKVPGASESGLTLELNVFCPSVWEHWFKHFHFVDDADENGPGPVPGCPTPTWHDPYHGWYHDQLILEPSGAAIRRIFADINPDFPRFKAAFAPVPGVTKLVLRRQMRRKLDRYSIGALLGALCCLEDLVLEPWRPWGGAAVWVRSCVYQSSLFLCLPDCSYFTRQVLTFPLKTGLYSLVSDVLPKIRTLKRICIFEDINEDIVPILNEYIKDLHQIDRVVPPFRLVDHDLGQSLALTSRSLRRRGSHGGIADLLCHAARVALQMPKLQTLVIWDGAQEVAGAFIYRVTAATCASIQWRGLSSVELRGRVEAAWQQVADEFGLFGIFIEGTQLITETILSHGDAIHHLDLPCQVVSPVSLWQIRGRGPCRGGIIFHEPLPVRWERQS